MLKKLCIFAVGLVFAVVLVAFAWVRWERHECEAYLAELRAAGEPLTFREIDALRAQPPQGVETVADVVTRVAVSLDELPSVDPCEVIGKKCGPTVDFFHRIDWNELGPTRAFVTARRDQLAELEGIRGLPPGRFAISYEGPASEVLTRPIESLPDVRAVVRLLGTDASLRLLEGDLAAAIDHSELMRLASTPLADEPAIIPYLVRIACTAKSLRTVEDALRVGVVDEASLARLEADLRSYLGAHSLEWAVLGERALFLGTFDELRAKSRIPFTTLLILTYPDQELGTRLYTRILDAADRPARLLETRDWIETTLSDRPRRTLITGTLVSSPNYITLHVQLLSEIQSLRTIIAAERFRLAEGHLPSMLEEIVPRFLDAPLTDPFSGEPLRLRRVDGGIVVYSVGRDRVDDGGIVDPFLERRPPDVGYRLVDEAQRGLVVESEPPEGAGQ